jgi:Mce-associated membrane protein
LLAEEVFGCMGGEPPDRLGGGAQPAVADMVAELAEAEAAEADALAEAARARARADEVRVDAADGETAEPEPEPGPDAPEPDAPGPDAPGPDALGPTRARTRQTAGLALAALLTAAALTLTALMLWQHGRVSAQRAGDRRFVDAARDGIVALLSIEHTDARADVQRVLDLSTGQFHDDFARSADDFVKTAQDSQAVTKGSVTVAALERVDGDQAVVLIAATSEVTNVSGARQDPRPFRISVTVKRDGEQCKMSDVEFVP